MIWMQMDGHDVNMRDVYQMYIGSNLPHCGPHGPQPPQPRATTPAPPAPRHPIYGGWRSAAGSGSGGSGWGRGVGSLGAGSVPCPSPLLGDGPALDDGAGEPAQPAREVHHQAEHQRGVLQREHERRGHPMHNPAQILAVRQRLEEFRSDNGGGGGGGGGGASREGEGGGPWLPRGCLGCGILPGGAERQGGLQREIL